MVAWLNIIGKKIIQAVKRGYAYLRKHQYAVLVVVVVIIFLALAIWAANLRWGQGQGWADWTGLAEYRGMLDKDNRGKTLWDWLELLIIPAVLALGALFFNWQQRLNELKIADNNMQDEVLRNYLDKMSELILEKNLLKIKYIREKASENEDIALDEEALEKQLNNNMRAVRDVARNRTITALKQLNKDRRNFILQFLHDTGLSSFLLVDSTMDNLDLSQSIIFSANLSHAFLNWANLTESRMEEVKLELADLVGTNLSHCDLAKADLFGANLVGANLTFANLKEADLNDANLKDANLNHANLTGASVSFYQLDTALSLNGAIMPDGKMYDPDVHRPRKVQITDTNEQIEKSQ